MGQIAQRFLAEMIAVIDRFEDAHSGLVNHREQLKGRLDAVQEDLRGIIQQLEALETDEVREAKILKTVLEHYATVTMLTSRRTG